MENILYGSFRTCTKEHCIPGSGGHIAHSDRWNKIKVTYRLLGGPGERLRGPGERLRGDGLPRPLLVDSSKTTVSNSSYNNLDIRMKVRQLTSSVTYAF
jgi:hypothetical protein